jgi:cation transport regulator ChaC
MIELIRQGQGSAGGARDYLAKTVHHLNQLGLPDARLAALLREVNAED